MTEKGRRHREGLVDAAMRLFRRQGYAGTGLMEILELSGAPRGSLYHYFPGGKEAIGQAAVERAGERVAQRLEELAREHPEPAAFVRAWFAQYAEWMQESGFASGCPIASTLLETAPGSAGITRAGDEALGRWIARVATIYEEAGWPAATARAQAELGVAALEGALILARVQQSVEPLVAVGEAIAARPAPA